MKEQQAFTHTQSQRPASYSQRNNRQPPSANPHKAGHYSGLHPDDAPYQSSELDDVEEDDSYYSQRPRTNVKRYDESSAPTQGNVHYAFHPDQVQHIPHRRTAAQQQRKAQAKWETDNVTVAPPKHAKRSGFHVHWSVFLGSGMVVMLGLWIGGTSLLSWWQIHQDDAQYGRPHTAQYDVVVGHHDSPTNPTHFIALNLHSRVEIVEIPGGDVSKAKIYQGPQILGPGSDMYPVTLSFPQDVNGKVDMQVHVQGDTFTYLNQNGQFVPQPTP